MLSDLEAWNIQQLEDLNQRGGRMLTVVDLIEAGTISAPMAAAVMYSLAQGASLLTAARPGGAGKTTVLAAFLNLLPPGVKIVTVDSVSVIRRAESAVPSGPECYLVHEIGDGHWYGYLWGKPVAEYFRLMSAQRRIASCLHADTLEELQEILCQPALGVKREAIDRVGIIAFLHVDWRLGSGSGIRRRVSWMECRKPYMPVTVRFVWERTQDTFQTTPVSDGNPELGEGPSAQFRWQPAEFERFETLIQSLLDRQAKSLTAVRAEIVAFYREHPELYRR